MNVADEGTSAHLNIFVDEHTLVNAMNPSVAIQYVNKSFERWGLPAQIKVDNGHPFVNPRGSQSPTKAILWWTGLGIEVIQNKPGCPQQNGTVECLQGIMHRWSDPASHNSIAALQERLNEESEFQRNHYQMPARNYKTRIELYAELETNERIYRAENFDMNLVYEYLAKKVFHRTIKRSGNVPFVGEYEYIGNKYQGVDVTVTFDPGDKLWCIRKEDGTLLKTSKKGVPTEQEIVDFALGKK